MLLSLGKSYTRPCPLVSAALYSDKVVIIEIVMMFLSETFMNNMKMLQFFVYWLPKYFSNIEPFAEVSVTKECLNTYECYG